MLKKTRCFIRLYVLFIKKGVCLYEFMCGMVPYGEDATDPYEIYEEIIKQTLNFPNYVKDKLAKNLMVQLLSKIPELRLGSSFAALKANVWFNNFDWVFIKILCIYMIFLLKK